MFHVFGLSSVLNVSVRFGGTLVLVPRFDADTVIAELARYRCTLFSGVPTMYIALLHADTGGRDLSALRVGVSGGAPILGEVIRSFEEKFPNVVILEGYGLSETASTTTFNINAEQRKVLSIGKPIWGVEVRTVDENDNELASGSDNVGEIVIRGHNVMKGYYKKPEATAAAVLSDGWLRTGDLGVMDEQGRLRFIGRAKDMLRVGGENVAPADVEEVLHAHPKVKQAQVIGVPDLRLGEVVAAYVVLNEGAASAPEELIQWCKSRCANFKVPRYLRIIDTFEGIGMTGSNKVQKNKLRQQALKDFKLT
jgi:long-chain acyl-CoA synthetase